MTIAAERTDRNLSTLAVKKIRCTKSLDPTTDIENFRYIVQPYRFNRLNEEMQQSYVSHGQLVLYRIVIHGRSKTFTKVPIVLPLKSDTIFETGNDCEQKQIEKTA